ncbi:MAG: ROK family protein [Bacteroidota bacterium]
MNNDFAIGVDVGGTHITSAVVDLTENRVLENTLAGRDVDPAAASGEIIRAWSAAIGESMERSPSPVKGVGMAMPGPFDYAGGVALIKDQPKLRSLYGINVGEAILKELRQAVPVRYINDASAFAVGEAFAGSGKGYEKLMVITLGTGFGSAFLENGIPVIGRDDVPDGGCVWHLPHGDGIADDYFSTRWFVGQYEVRTGEQVKGVKELAERVETDETARQLFREFGSGLGAFLAPWFRQFGATALVAGGNISRAWDLFGEAFNEALETHGLNLDTKVSQLKEHAALIGSAYLLVDPYWDKMKDVVPLM